MRLFLTLLLAQPTLHFPPLPPTTPEEGLRVEVSVSEAGQYQLVAAWQDSSGHTRLRLFGPVMSLGAGTHDYTRQGLPVVSREGEASLPGRTQNSGWQPNVQSRGPAQGEFSGSRYPLGYTRLPWDCSPTSS